MTLPKRPERSAPIPNNPFESPEVSSIKGPYWDMPLGSGLESDSNGSVQTSGSDPTEPTAMLYGPNGFVGVGSGLQIGDNGELETSSSYIYCTPAYPTLPPSGPPYSCETEVNTAGVTDFANAWNGCNLTGPLPCIDTSSGQSFYQAFSNNNWNSFPTLNFSSGTYFALAWAENVNLTEFPIVNISNGGNFEGAWYNCDGLTTFPLLDFSSATVLGDRNNLNYGAWEECSNLTSFPAINTSNVEKFTYTWGACTSLTSFPVIDTSKGTDFNSTWQQCSSLTSFPLLDVSSGTDFGGTWSSCSSLTSFPPLDFSSGADFSFAWFNCTSLTSFPAGLFNSCLATDFAFSWNSCALNQTSVDNILVSINAAGTSNGTLGINGGTASAPGAAGLAAKAALQARGWTVLTN